MTVVVLGIVLLFAVCFILSFAAAVLFLVVVGVDAWRHRKRRTGRRWAAGPVARFRRRQERYDEIAMLERLYAADSAEERS